MTWAVRLWPRYAWGILPDDITANDDGSVTIPFQSRMLAEAYLSLVPVLALDAPHGFEGNAARAKLVMTAPGVEVGVN